MKNVTVYIMKNEMTQFTIPFVTKLSVGRKLIYVEYQEDGQTRIRAFGRAEFDAVSIDGDDGEEVTFPLQGNNFRRISSRFAVGEDVAEDTDADDDIPEDEEIPF